MLALGDQGAHGGRLQAVAQPHGIRRRVGDGEEVAGVLLHHRLVLRVVRDHPVGPAAGAVGREEGLTPVPHLAVALAEIGHDELLVDDGEAHQRGDEGRVGLGEREAHAVRIQRLGTLHAGEQVGEPLADRLHPVEGEDHVIGGQRIAALELDIRAQREGEARSFALPACREVRIVAGRPLLRDEQGVVHVEHEDGIGVVRRLGGIELADRDLVETQHPAGLDDMRCRAEHRRQRGGRQQFHERSHVIVLPFHRLRLRPPAAGRHRCHCQRRHRAASSPVCSGRRTRPTCRRAGSPPASCRGSSSNEAALT